MSKTIFAILILISSQLYSQSNTALLQKNIDIYATKLRMDSLLRIISKSTGVQFSFNSTRINPSTIIPVKKNSQTLGQWLELIRLHSGAGYKIVGEHIILIEPQKTGSKEKAIKHSPQKEEARDSQRSNNFVNAKTEHSPFETDFPPQINLPVPSIRDSIHYKKPDLVFEHTVDQTVDHSPDNSRRANLLKLELGGSGVGVGFEKSLSRALTLELSTSLGGGYEIDDGELTYYLLQPAIHVSFNPRFYYNVKKRQARSKITSLNSANYIGLRIKYVTKGLSETFDARDAILINTHWGLQRMIAKRWTFNFFIGLGYAVDASDLNNIWDVFYPEVEFKFSYIITKSREN
jgi:hypothetical protein